MSKKITILCILIVLVLTGCQANLLQTSKKPTNQQQKNSENPNYIHNLIVDSVNSMIAKAEISIQNYKNFQTNTAGIDTLTMRIDLNNLRNQLIATKTIIKDQEQNPKITTADEANINHIKTNYLPKLQTYIDSYELWLNQLVKNPTGPITTTNSDIEKNYIDFIQTHNDLVVMLNGGG
ncbi:hypothetical protein KA036_01275 [Candidatus Gracilibacteria bacterium]|nr:hypothetical protein [Candidatus Gracilibacteria bacterium]